MKSFSRRFMRYTVNKSPTNANHYTHQVHYFSRAVSITLVEQCTSSDANSQVGLGRVFSGATGRKSKKHVGLRERKEGPREVHGPQTAIRLSARNAWLHFRRTMQLFACPPSPPTNLRPGQPLPAQLLHRTEQALVQWRRRLGQLLLKLLLYLS